MVKLKAVRSSVNLVGRLICLPVNNELKVKEIALRREMLVAM